MGRMAFLLGLLAGLLACVRTGHGQPVAQPHSSAELLSEYDALVPGTPAVLGLLLRLEPAWHAYWKNPGDSGMATSLSWTLPAGWATGPLQWPAPQRIDAGPITSYGYSREVLLPVELTLPAKLATERVTLRAQADWLVCKDICIPASAPLEITLPVASRRTRNSASGTLFDAARAQMPHSSPAWHTRVTRHADDLALTLTMSATPPPTLRSLTFIPDREGAIVDSFPQGLQRTTGGYVLPLKADATGTTLQRLTGVLVAEPGFAQGVAMSIDAPVEPGSAPPTGPPPMTTVVVLALAFMGGLLLNLMPCVFPILAIKVLGVLERAHGRAGALREHGILFTVGVLGSFLLMAGGLLWLRAQGTALGWGFQLQSPMVVSALASLFLVLGLNLSSVFTFGSSAQALAGRVQLANARADALASGLLATLVATPCTAPFMGAAVGYAVTRPASEALLVFGAIGLGMALPYATLCLFPSALRRLPRPGRWMETLKQLLAFPLYGTVVWLLWVLGQQSGIDAVARLMLAMLTLACGLWLWGRLSLSGAPRAIVLMGFFGLALWIGWPRPDAHPSENAWTSWSPMAVQEALEAGQPVFVDFTAAWCVSCQVNKRLVLHTEPVSNAFDAAGVKRMRADWTHRDPAITLALEQLGRNGVPVYALYAPGGGEPELLPEILTRGIVLDALAALPRGPTPQSPAPIPSRRTP